MLGIAIYLSRPFGQSPLPKRWHTRIVAHVFCFREIACHIAMLSPFAQVMLASIEACCDTIMKHRCPSGFCITGFFRTQIVELSSLFLIGYSDFSSHHDGVVRWVPLLFSVSDASFVLIGRHPDPTYSEEPWKSFVTPLTPSPILC